MKSALLVVAGFVGCANAERYWLHRVGTMPSARTFEVQHYFTVDTTDSPQFSLTGPVLFKNRVTGATTTNVASSLQLHVIHHSLLDNMQTDHFCCSQHDIDLKKCLLKDRLIITQSEKGREDAVSYDLGDDSVKFKKWRPAHSGLYFVAFSQCGGEDLSHLKFDSGELVLSGKSGYLPAEEQPKLSFYFALVCVYAVLFVGWVWYCYPWSDVLFTIHHFISWTLACGLVEAVCWYASLFHWNFLGHRWHSMMALGTIATTMKQGVSYALLLLACHGVGVTKPRVDSKLLVQVVLCTGAFVVCDVVRQFMMAQEMTGSENWSTLSTILIVSPGSLFLSTLYVWIIQALQDTIRELGETKQSAKVEIYQSLRLALGTVLGFAVVLVAYEAAVVKKEDLSTNWQNRWIFSDLCSHLGFLLLLIVIMWLWRPNENTQNVAFSEQLGTDDNIELSCHGNENDNEE